MQLTNRRVHLMGTVIDVSIYHNQPEPVLDQVEALLHLYNKRFSANDDSSELMQINKAAGIHPVKVHPELFELISLGKWHSCQVESHLNIAIGPLIQTWRIGFSDARLPHPTEISPLLNLINPTAISLFEDDHSVFLKEKGMKIDLGALAKGFIADRIADFLKAEKVTSALINLGGNVLTFGPALHNPDHKWRIGIQNPKETRNTNLMVLAIRDQSVVTSGIYERTFEIDGKTYHHIFDSQTGYPVTSNLASLTIISPLSVDGEIWTTRLFGSSLEHIFQEVSAHEDLEAIIIDKDNYCFQTSGVYKIRLS